MAWREQAAIRRRAAPIPTSRSPRTPMRSRYELVRQRRPTRRVGYRRSSNPAPSPGL